MEYVGGYNQIDGYTKVEFETTEVPEGYARAYRLENNDVVNICGNILEFENNLLHEVEEFSYYEYIEGIKVKTTTYQRTGKKLTLDQASALAL